MKKVSFVIYPNDIVFAMSPTTNEHFRTAIEESIPEIQAEQDNESDQQAASNLSTWESSVWLRFSVSIGGGAFPLLVILSIILKNKVEEKTEDLNSREQTLRTSSMRLLRTLNQISMKVG